MITFTTIIKKFDDHGDKTGWTYIEVPADIAGQLNPENKKGFRVKGKLDNYAIQGVSLIPMGGGQYILAVNATIRKGLKKNNGAMVKVQLALDKPYELSKELMDCLSDEPTALKFFNSLPPRAPELFFKMDRKCKD